MRPTDEGRIEKIKKSKPCTNIEPLLGFAKDVGGHDV
jgi:hypothetical protein